MSVSNKVVLLTGATGGLGQALAHELCSKGLDVVLCAKDIKKLESLYDTLEKRHPGKAHILPLNLLGATPADFETVQNTLEQTFQKCDVLIHAAAFFHGLTPFEHLTAEQWFNAFQVNVHAPFMLTRQLLPLLKRAEKAHVIFVLDEIIHTLKAYYGPYASSKAAIAAFAEVLNAEYDHTTIQVRTFTSKPMPTALRKKIFPEEDASLLTACDEEAKRLVGLL